jgi:hypothetical protein
VAASDCEPDAFDLVIAPFLGIGKGIVDTIGGILKIYDFTFANTSGWAFADTK